MNTTEASSYSLRTVIERTGKERVFESITNRRNSKIKLVDKKKTECKYSKVWRNKLVSGRNMWTNVATIIRYTILRNFFYNLKLYCKKN